MNVFYPSGSNIETNAFEINSCQPANSHNIPRIVRYMPNRKLCPFSNTLYCGALLSKELYKISHFQEHGSAALFWVNKFKYSLFSWSPTRQCGALLSTTTYHCGALSRKNFMNIWINYPAVGCGLPPKPPSPTPLPGRGRVGCGLGPPLFRGKS